MSHDLAIIIPAYKSTYLGAAVRSLFAQTNQNFSLYIADDASPEPIRECLERIGALDRLTYFRFQENMGQQSLTLHWKRCLELTQGEPWIWFFSDDDLMDPECVENFYRARQEHPNYDIYRFNTRRIDSEGAICKQNYLPEDLSASRYLNAKLSCRNESYMVEWIFSRKAYQEVGGFPDMRLAWSSDELFWMKLAIRNGIRTISGSEISWRYSGLNFSSWKRKTMCEERVESVLKFLEWVLSDPYLSRELQSPDLPSIWFINQLKLQRDCLNLWQELKYVHRMSLLDQRVWKHYLKLVKNEPKLILSRSLQTW